MLKVDGLDVMTDIIVKLGIDQDIKYSDTQLLDPDLSDVQFSKEECGYVLRSFGCHVTFTNGAELLHALNRVEDQVAIKFFN